MKSLHFSPPTPFRRLVCLILCYSLVAPLLTTIPYEGIVEVSAAPSAGPTKETPPNKQGQTAQKPRWRDGELLVRFRPDARPSDAETLLEANGAERAGVLSGKSGVERLRLDAGSDPEAAAAAMRASKLVDFVEPNYLITADQVSPNDPRFAEQWALRNPGVGAEGISPDINAPRAWEVTTGANQTVVAVLDSGVDFTHPDLTANRWGNTFELAGNGLDDDRNGFADDLHGWDFVDNSKEIRDDQGHGTAVAGIIAAEGNNATGITGVMWRAGLMSLRVLDNTGTGDVAGAVEAIDYAAANGAQVINCSWGTDDGSVALLDAINRASTRGVVVVASAGNGSRDLEASPRYPASFDLNNLIAVASTDSSDQLAAWSNRGSKRAALAAPGTHILTTRAGGGYDTINGSSASAPFVSGVAGLIKTLRPWLNADRTRALLLDGVRQAHALWGKVASGGVVNAAGALGRLNALATTEGLDDGNGNNGKNGGEHGTKGRPDPTNNGNEIAGGGAPAVEPLPVTPGSPGPGLPNLDQLRRKQPTVPRAKPPIPSDRCSHRSPHCQGGRAAGDSLPAPNLEPGRLLAWSLELPDVGALLKEVSGLVSDSAGPLAIFGSAPAPLAPPLPLAPPVEAVVWTNAGGVSVAGNTLKKTTAASWNGGASSTKALAAGDGYVEFTISEVNTNRMVGLSNGDASKNYTEIDFAIYAHATGVVYINENGTSRGAHGPYAVGDTLRVAVEGGFVKYYKNTTLLYTSAVAPTYPLLVDTSLYTTGATVTDAVISGMLQGDAPTEGVVWTNVVGATELGGDLTKTAATAWGNAGAVSVKSIPFGDCYVEWTVLETNLTRAVGLGTGDSNQAISDIAFALQMNSAGVLYVNESGTNRGNMGAYATGDKLRVSVQDRVVRYWRNGTLLYESSIKPTYPLVVDTALYTVGATITDVVLSHEPNNEQGGPNYDAARVDHLNRTGLPGVDLLSRNINWTVPLMGLPGRAGLDLELSLSYNSLVWTKAGSTITFDADQGTPSPGFRLGFPVIQPPYYNDLLDTNAYLLITPSGDRVELRQVGTTNVYEAGDSSYLQLIDYGDTTMLVRDTEGTMYLYTLSGGEYHCTQIKDRNGNFITVSYRSDGQINTITDTLARVITFNYDANQNLISITQPWAGGPQPHEWVTFGWGSVNLDTTFTSLTVVGPQDNTSIPVLTQVSYADGTYYKFEYNTRGQVTTVRHYADDDHQRSYTTYTIVASSTDCPRPSQRKVWAENWNGQNGVPAEAITNYTFNPGVSGEFTMPADTDTVVYKAFFATAGWQRGLTTSTELWSGGLKKKWTTTAYTQDDEGLGFQKNPRVVETNDYDAEGNRQRTTIDYGSDAQGYKFWGLPYLVTEYAADGATEIRHTYTDYNLGAAYISRRVIGLVSARHISNTLVWQSVVHYTYDEGGSQLVATSPATTQHDAAYGTGLMVGRGNLTTITRYDADDINNAAKRAVTRLGYNTNGSVVFSKDPLNRQTTFSYTDSFSDGVTTRNTFAYQTKVTPPTAAGETAADFENKTQYNYDFGATTRTQGPVPAGQTQGPVETMEYDAAGRISRINYLASGSYRRWVYAPNGSVSTFDTIKAGAAEAYSATVYDGAGRVRATGGDHPGTTGLFRGQFTLYDLKGRASQKSNPAEINSNWTPVGDDAAGWVWTQQTYDWNDRPRLTTNPDGTTKEATYSGCGCAGGEVVTLRDEMNRRQRHTSDVLGRVWKSEVLNWDQTVYSTKTNTYNSLDRITRAYMEQGTPGSGTGQESLTTYDGHGRATTTRAPQQTAPSITTYNADDTISQVKDARGATTTYTYNFRKQVTAITYSAPAGVAATPAAAFNYDAAGNRLWMTDGLGRVDYQYDALSRLTSETRQLNGLGSYTFTYSYNLGDDLTSVTDPFGAQVGYTYDHIGQLTGITGSGYAGMSQYASGMQYRAWGVLKRMTYGNNLNLAYSHNNRLQITRYDLTNSAGGSLLGQEYQYDGDGRLSFSHDLNDQTLDRTYSYDQAGRLKIATSGSQGTNAYGTYWSGPYDLTFGYDVWGNLSSRTWRTWNTFQMYRYQQQNSFFDTYTNNRNSTWQYDADGRVTAAGPRTYSYDAAGEVVASSEPGKNITQSFDGTGERVVLVENGVATYYLRSTALGGHVATEINGSGQKVRGYVVANGQVIAKQESNQVQWDHREPTGVSTRMTNASGAVSSKVEMDPLGVIVDPNNAYFPTTYNVNPAGFYGSPGDSKTGCFAASLGMPCGPTNLNNRGVFCGAAMSASQCSSANSYEASLQGLYGYRYWDLPGRHNEGEQGMFRHDSMLRDGFDPAFGIYRGEVEITATVDGQSITQVLIDPTPEQISQAASELLDELFEPPQIEIASIGGVSGLIFGQRGRLPPSPAARSRGRRAGQGGRGRTFKDGAVHVGGVWRIGGKGPKRLPPVGYSSRYPKDFASKNTVNKSAQFRNEREARAFALRHLLGRSYGSIVEVGPNKWRSSDGRWQYRSKPGDLSGSHIHLEQLNPATGEVLVNWHLTFPPPRNPNMLCPCPP